MRGASVVFFEVMGTAYTYRVHLSNTYCVHPQQIQKPPKKLDYASLTSLSCFRAYLVGRLRIRNALDGALTAVVSHSVFSDKGFFIR